MKLVIDTDVLVAALRSPSGASRLLVRAVRAGAVEALCSVPMMLEYEAVLKRPTHLTATGLAAPDVDRFLDGWAGLVTPVDGRWTWRPSVRDEDDELFVDCAVNGGADVIVTFNTRDFRPLERGRAHLGFGVCRPGDVLRRLTWRP